MTGPGSVALVTGGTRGIGLGIADRLLAEGRSVCITARRAEELTKARALLGHGDRVLTVTGGSDDPAHRAAAVQAAVERFGRLDLLVNNAGTNPVFGPTIDLEQSAAEKIIGVNLLACLGWTKEFHFAWAGEHGGAVVNISSYSAIRPSPGIGMYAVSKAALIQLTRQLALELSPKVRVNAVLPALVKTRMASQLYEGRESEVAASYPLGRLGTPSDIASAVLFLGSEESSWITGQTLVLDGGLDLTGGVE